MAARGGGAILVTPEAAADLAAKPLRLLLYLGLDPSEPDAVELVRNTAAEVSP